ncbi:DUF6233 domain-containing protein [Streptomyces rubiginosohelvolus]|uniref:DUF6233 domain-containing protein n=1 Tax=Streptomyces rubiginosohelvolus TaxID=67362 RepID=UPI003402E30D
MNEQKAGEATRLDLLRFLERVQEQDLARTRHWITTEERRLAESAARRPPPPPPDWVLEAGIGAGRRPVAVHQGFCKPQGARVRAISGEEARRLIAADTGLACQLCRPDTELGLL